MPFDQQLCGVEDVGIVDLCYLAILEWHQHFWF
jgi:hypothetical protein